GDWLSTMYNYELARRSSSLDPYRREYNTCGTRLLAGLDNSIQTRSPPCHFLRPASYYCQMEDRHGCYWCYQVEKMMPTQCVCSSFARSGFRRRSAARPNL